MEESHLRVRKFPHPNGDTVMIPVENANKTEGVNSNVGRDGSIDMGAGGASNTAPGGNNGERLFKRKLGESDMVENRRKTEEEIATEKIEEREAKKKDRDSLVLWGRPRTTLYYSLLETIILLKSLPSK